MKFFKKRHQVILEPIQRWEIREVITKIKVKLLECDRKGFNFDDELIPMNERQRRIYDAFEDQIADELIKDGFDKYV